MTTQWVKSVPTIEVEDVDTEDILAPLIRLRTKYEDRAAKLAQTAHGEGAASKLRASKFYIQAADAIDRLIVIGNSRTITG